MRLILFKQFFTICRLGPREAIPDWIPETPFFSINRTEDELSILCISDGVPPAVKQESGWRCFKFVGPFDFSLTGILTSILNPLAEVGAGILAISTFDTDYVLVREKDLTKALSAIRSAGHEVT